MGKPGVSGVLQPTDSEPDYLTPNSVSQRAFQIYFSIFLNLFLPAEIRIVYYTKSTRIAHLVYLIYLTRFVYLIQ